MTATLPSVREFLYPLAHRQRHPDGPQRRVVARDGIVEKDHEPITGEPLQGPLEAGYEVAQGSVILPEDLPDILGFSRFGQGGEAAQVTAHHRDLAAVRIEERCTARADDKVSQLHRKEAAQPAHAFQLFDLVLDALLKLTVPPRQLGGLTLDRVVV